MKDTWELFGGLTECMYSEFIWSFISVFPFTHINEYLIVLYLVAHKVQNNAFYHGPGIFTYNTLFNENFIP